MNLYKCIQTITMVFIIAFTVLFITIPLHEFIHVIISTLDPGLTVIEIHLYSPELWPSGIGGYITVIGSPELMPLWMQEIYAYGAQLIILCICIILYLKKHMGVCKKI